MDRRNPSTRMKRARSGRTGAATLGLIMASAMVVAGCSTATDGSSASPSSTGSAPAAAAAQGITKDTIKIGMLGPYSGSASIYSKANRLAESIYKEINDKGGINGRKIELVIGDDNCDAASMQGLIRKFVEQDKVFMIHGGSCSNALVAAKPLIEESRIPFLTMNAASAAISDPPVVNLFHSKATVAEQIDAMAAFMESNKDAKNVAIAATSDEWGQGYVKLLKPLLANSSLKVSTTEELDPQGGDSTPAIRKIINSKPDMAAVYAYPQPMTVFLKSARPQGLNIPIVTGDGTRPDEQATRLGNRALAENFFSAYSFTAPFDDPKFDHFKQLFTKDHASLGWDTVALEGAVSAEFNIAVLTAMKDDLTWDNWIKTAESGTFDTVASGPMTFKPFAKDDARTRRPGIQLHFSALDPKSDGAKTVVVDTWADWLALTK